MKIDDLPKFRRADIKTITLMDRLMAHYSIMRLAPQRLEITEITGFHILPETLMRFAIAKVV